LSDQANLWHWLADTLEHQSAVMLMIVVSSTGSSPGKAGAKMAVTAQGDCFGTIGGGAIEYSMVRHAQTLLEKELSVPELNLRRHVLTGGGQASGMICGGEQIVLLYRCQNGDLELFRRIAEMARHKIPGLLKLSPAGIQLDPSPNLPKPVQFSANADNDWLYQETLGIYKQAYLIGGGHVSLALSKILATLDFDITVIDERDMPDTLARNTDAHRKLTMSYNDIDKAVPEGDQVFVFIMTHSHKTDEKAAELLAEKKLRYLGVLGSRKKIAQLKENLGSRLSTDALKRIRGPIGLPIQSHTPAEIAVSIAAELIGILNAGESNTA